ncbi:MAG TPA: hypothetical protein VD761_01480 [Solirubrobacterales bacterium]|jgi:hypothetical protein|nr:hypothetical protein [Solirubrobacterales bacterium]
MAKDDDKQHQMLFDIRGRRKNVVKVVYAVLALLMGGSLFLTVGPFSIAEIFNDGTATSDLAKSYEEEAERIEAKLAKTPDDPTLLLRLTRAQINAGNGSVELDENRQPVVTTEAVQHYLQAYQSWSEYLESTKDPNPNLAQLVAPTLFQLAENSNSYAEASARVQSAADAQRIVAEERPSVNSWTTLAFYTAFTGDSSATNKAKAEAKKLTRSKTEVQAIDSQIEPAEKSAKVFLKQKSQAEKAEKAAAKGNTSAPESLENPLGGLGGGGLGE